MKPGWERKTLAQVCQIRPPKSEARKRLAADALVSFAPMEDLGIDRKFLSPRQLKPLASVVGNAYQRTYVITVNENGRVLYRFLYFQMLRCLERLKAQSVGAGTKFLKLGMIRGLEIALPGLDEQQRIVTRLDSLAAETQRLASIYEQKLTSTPTPTSASRCSSTR
jgi:hypothetical protein